MTGYRPNGRHPVAGVGAFPGPKDIYRPQPNPIGMPRHVSLEGDILRITLKGVVDPGTALEVQLGTREVMESARRPLDILVDISQATDADVRAKRILSDTVREDNPRVRRTAIVHSDHVSKARAKVVYLMGQRKDVEFFTDEAEAVRWLRGGAR